MAEYKHDSDSSFQKNKESKIIEEAIVFLGKHNILCEKSVKVNRCESFYISGDEKVKMQFDLFLEESKVIGELYVTRLPLNAGRKRKLMTDVLKMITFEKYKQKIGEVDTYKKFYFLTASKDDFIKENIELKDAKFIKHTPKTTIIGKQNAWINTTFELFNVELYYYLVDDDFLKELSSIRLKQIEGMARKK